MPVTTPELTQIEQPAGSADYQVHEHYKIERELAAKLRSASKAERRRLYSTLYDELYRRVPRHPQLTKKVSTAQSEQRTALQMLLLRRYLHPRMTVLEVGPGSCALAFHVAKTVRFVYGVDVSDEVTKRTAAPANFKLALSDGTSIPVPPSSIDLAYSNQLMEHLHPDDALEQLQNIRESLAPNGRYVCITPSRLTGPHDVSKYFDPVATGFHLKEYSTSELARLLEQVGFRRIRALIGGRGLFVAVPIWLIEPIERLLERRPLGQRRRLAHRLAAVLGVRMVAHK